MPYFRRQIEVRAKKPEYGISPDFKPDRKDSVIHVPEGVNISKAWSNRCFEHANSLDLQTLGVMYPEIPEIPEILMVYFTLNCTCPVSYICFISSERGVDDSQYFCVFASRHVDIMRDD